VQLFKSYCLPFILYATEALSLDKSSVKKLDDCIQRAVGKIFNVKDINNIAVVRRNCDYHLLVRLLNVAVRNLSASYWTVSFCHVCLSFDFI